MVAASRECDTLKLWDTPTPDQGSRGVIVLVDPAGVSLVVSRR